MEHIEAVENKPFRSQAIATAKIYNWFKENTWPGRYFTIDECYMALKSEPEIYKAQQVRDCVKTFFRNKVLARIRVGQPYAYWFAENSAVGRYPTKEELKQQAAAAVAETEAEAEAIDVETFIGKPKIHVMRNQIVIEHAKCKITIDFDE